MLVDALPPFLGELLEFQKLMEAEQPAWDQAEDSVEEMHKDFSLFTLTEYGVKRWEAILGLAPGKQDSLEERKNRILLAYLSKLPYTYRTLLRYLAQVTQEFQVDLNHADYELYLRVKLAGYGERTALLAVLREMIPANLVLKLQTAIPQAIRSASLYVCPVSNRQVRHVHQVMQRKESRYGAEGNLQKV